jgi:5-formyltetrahydrofolate cyclo-ligase
VSTPEQDFALVDDAERQQWVRSAKQTLRRRMRAQREVLPPSVVSARSQQIILRLLEHEWVKAAKGVGLFWPMQARREVDLRALDEQLRARGVSTYYPHMGPSDDGGIATCMRRVAHPDDLVLQDRRFHMPTLTSPLAERGDVDVIIVPAIAASPDGHRLGYGSGFYDATLPDYCPPGRSIVVAYHFQMLVELPLEAHDVACDAVVTEQSTFTVSTSA